MVLTKDQEVARFKEFIEGLPKGSYLIDLIGHLVPEVERMIRCDLAWPLSVAQAFEARQHEEMAIAELRKEEESLRRKCASLKVHIDRLGDKLRDCRTTAQHVAETVSSLV